MSGSSSMHGHTQAGLRRVVALVSALNLSYFGVEFAVAVSIGSVSLLADSIDFLEDATVNLLILLALRWSAPARAKVGIGLAILLLVPSVATAWALWHKFGNPSPPEPHALSLTGTGALVVNLLCAAMLVRYRKHSGSLTKAAFLSARNDAIANIAIISAGLITFVWTSFWPDAIVGIGIAVMNADAARAVIKAATREIADDDADFE